jgi:hypothetical protein
MEAREVAACYYHEESDRGLVKKTLGSPKKTRISIAIDQGFLIWVDEMIKKGIFANRSHAVHRALLKLKEDVIK